MEYLELDVDKIELDLDNPRIKQWIEMYGDEITSEGIALALTASAGTQSTSTYTSLKESIRVNKGIINPIIVNKRPDGKMVVIEGNTRVQIYKEFAEADPKGPWKKIISIVYDDLEESQVHAIRLQAHLVGPRDWDPFSKAKYLNQLSNIDKLPMPMIISFCGGKKKEIEKLIDAYQDMIQYYFPLAEKCGMDPDPREFSKFAELQNSNIKQALVVNHFNKEDFARWVINQNIDTAQNVRRIPSVLSNEKAKEVFLKKNVSEAMKYTVDEGKTSKSLNDASMNDLVVELINRCKNIEYRYIKDLKNDPRLEGNKQNISELLDELNEIYQDIESE